MKFSAEEMAYDPTPEETDNWIPIGRGQKAYERFRKWKKSLIRLEPDVAKVFSDAASVNKALRNLIKAMPDRKDRKRQTA